MKIVSTIFHYAGVLDWPAGWTRAIRHTKASPELGTSGVSSVRKFGSLWGRSVRPEAVFRQSSQNSNWPRRAGRPAPRRRGFRIPGVWAFHLRGIFYHGCRRRPPVHAHAGASAHHEPTAYPGRHPVGDVVCPGCERTEEAVALIFVPEHGIHSVNGFVQDGADRTEIAR